MRAFPALLLAATIAQAQEPAGRAARNVALGRPYTLEPSPSYPLTTDTGDASQLTDGRHAQRGFWTDKAAVGWAGASLVTITVDLGSVFDVRGASFGTAAGAAEVEWPELILVLGSVDGRSFSSMGDLVALDAAEGHAPATEGFERHVFAASGLQGRARFVRFMIGATGRYVFADEVEVFGEPAASQPTPPNATTDTGTLFWQARAAPRLRAEVQRRIEEARARLSGPGAARAYRAVLLERLDRLDAEAARLTAADWGRVSAQYPMNALHAGAFEVLGAIEQREGAPPLAAWPANPWDAVDMATPPPALRRELDVAVMNGEVRSTALDLRNSTDRALTVSVDLSGVDALERGFVEGRPVAWSGDADGRPVALALLPPAPRRNLTVLEIPAGVTRQVWLTFAPTKVRAGRYQRAVRITARGLPDLAVTARVSILPGRFPQAQRLHVGGWDYLHARGVPVPAGALDTTAALLRSFGVDLPWATAAAMPFGAHDREGRMVRTPDTSVLDAWLARWPRAARYRVFVNARDELSGIRRGTAAFEAAVRSWATFWAAHVAARGVDPGAVDLLFVDEPHGDPALADRQIAWARALNASDSGFRVFVDPTYADPGQTPAALVESASTLCLNRRLVEESGEPYHRFAARLVGEEQKAVELYDAVGPTSKVDPYAFHRLMAWRAFDVGASAVGFWGFTDTNSATSWREYLAPRIVYAPLFLDGSSVVPAKHLYAVREGVEDHAYLALLREAIAAQAARRPPDDPALVAARAVLDSALTRVLAASRPDAYLWSASTDRSVADAARLEIAAALERLGSTAR